MREDDGVSCLDVDRLENEYVLGMEGGFYTSRGPVFGIIYDALVKARSRRSILEIKIVATVWSILTREPA